MSSMFFYAKGNPFSSLPHDDYRIPSHCVENGDQVEDP